MEAKKHALRLIPYGLYLVGVCEKDGGGPNAFVASWVSQCSFAPPLVMVGVRKSNRSHGMILRSRVFTINVLGEEQKELATAFFRELDVVGDRMSGVRFTIGKTGAPLFPDTPASIECHVVSVHDHGGDHDVVVGEVVEAHVRAQARPLTHAATGWNYGG